MIDDGQEIAFYFKGVHNVHEEIRGHVRPMGFRDMKELRRKAQKGQKFDELMLAECEKRLLDWDLKDRAGEPIGTDTKSIGRLPEPLVDRLVDVVSGYGGGDVDPDAPAAEQAELSKLETLAEANGTTVGIERETADAKN